MYPVGGFDGIIGVLSQGAIALVLWYGGKLVFEGHVTPGLLTCKLLVEVISIMEVILLGSEHGETYSCMYLL